MKKKILRVGTRGSKLAVAQTQLILGMLQEKHRDIEFEITTIKTSGDIGLLQQLGAFTKEVEQALLDDKVDIAIHSYKDMPTEIHPQLVIAAIPTRGDERDCLVSHSGITFETLPMNARLGTSSLRRKYQINRLRPDLEVISINGNIISRMTKVESGELDGVVLASAGLDRIGMEARISSYFSLDEMLPAVAQGALAVQTRKDDFLTQEIVAEIHDHNTFIAAEAERAYLSALGGGCRMPVGAYAHVNMDNMMHIRGLYFSEDGSKSSQSSLHGKAGDYLKLGNELAEHIIALHASA